MPDLARNCANFSQELHRTTHTVNNLYVRSNVTEKSTVQATVKIQNVAQRTAKNRILKIVADN